MASCVSPAPSQRPPEPPSPVLLPSPVLPIWWQSWEVPAASPAPVSCHAATHPTTHGRLEPVLHPQSPGVSPAPVPVPRRGSGCPVSPQPSVPVTPRAPAGPWVMPGLWVMSGPSTRQALPRCARAKVQARAVSQPAWKRWGCINRAGSCRPCSYRGTGSTGEGCRGCRSREGPGGTGRGSPALHGLWLLLLVPGPSLTSLCSHRSPQRSGWRPRRPPLSCFSSRSQVRLPGAGRVALPGGAGNVPAVPAGPGPRER